MKEETSDLPVLGIIDRNRGEAKEGTTLLIREPEVPVTEILRAGFVRVLETLYEGSDHERKKLAFSM